MAINERERSELITMIYDAAIAPEKWQAVLQKIQIACGVDQCTLFFYDALCRSRNYASAAHIRPQAITTYLEKFIDEQAAEINHRLKHVPEGTVIHAKDLQQLAEISYEEVVGKDYLETVWPNLDFQACVVLLRSPQVCAGLGLQTFKENTQLAVTNFSLLQDLAVHLTKAVKIYQTLTLAHRQQAAFTHVIGALNQGVILLDSKLRILTSNAEAMRIIEHSSLFVIDRQGTLAKHASLDHAPLDDLLLKLKSGYADRADNHSTYKIISVPSASSSATPTTAPIKLSVCSFENEMDKVIFGDDACHLMLLNDPNKPWKIPSTYLEETYDLTATECELAHHLVNGESLENSAELCNVSLETARWRLKKVLKKTNTHSQAELSRLLMVLSGDFVGA